MKLLIDTNIIIGLEDAGEVKERFADLVRKCGEHGISVFVHEVSKEDINRDKDKARRTATLSKIAKFQLLKDVATPDENALGSLYGKLAKPNDVVDVKLLHTAATNVVDFLVTEDDGLHRRAKTAGIADRVFTVADTLAWIKQTFEPDEVFLPAVQSVKAYSFDFANSIFDELRADYDGFDKWAAKCVSEHRDCWIIKDGLTLAGIIIRKEETHAAAKTKNIGAKILKLCTFKIAESYRGQKLGEQLLKQALWHAQRNNYDLVYLTAYAKQEALIRLLEDYGFSRTLKIKNDELVFEKPIGHGAVAITIGESVLDAAHHNYPRFVDGSSVRKFVVPIRPHYHAKLFPEVANLPKGTVPAATGRPGNTIKKVYLCRSPSCQLRPGDLIFFYMTKSNSYGSQSLTSVGVVENVRLSGDLQEVRRWTAKRSVFSDIELRELVQEVEPLKIIDFLLIGHLGPTIPLELMTHSSILQSWPQSITQLQEEAYQTLKPHLNLGFDF
jgi:ribosomal protein S18 acetylase RimI-like enzyme